MLVTAKKETEEELKLPTRATYYSLIDEAEREKDQKVINYDEFLDLKSESETSDNISFETLNPDLLPSEATLRVLRGEPFKKEASKPVAKARPRAKGKAMIAVYAAAIVTLLLVVILNAVALVRLSVSTSSLEAEVARVRSAVTAGTEYAASLNGDLRVDEIVEAAKDMGYSFAE